jgi:hypothetical protein
MSLSRTNTEGDFPEQDVIPQSWNCEHNMLDEMSFLAEASGLSEVQSD